MKKQLKSTWLTVYSGSKLSLFSPILADGSSYTSISVVRFEVGCPFTHVYGRDQIVFYRYPAGVLAGPKGDRPAIRRDGGRNVYGISGGDQ